MVGTTPLDCSNGLESAGGASSKKTEKLPLLDQARIDEELELEHTKTNSI